ncbi:hypothetical protein pb186bvf_006675 [Paramecium bursaria]
MKTLIFKFHQSYDESIKLLEQTKANQQYFQHIVMASQDMKKLMNEDDVPGIKQFFETRIPDIPFLRIFIDESFEQIVLYRYDEMIEYFVESGYEVTNKRLIPSLIRLSSMMRLDPPTNTISLLIKGGLVVDECFDDNYRTPLHLACKYGIPDIIRLLVENGCDINAVDSKKRTPIMILNKAIRKYPDLEPLQQYLTAKGAQVY